MTITYWLVKRSEPSVDGGIKQHKLLQWCEVLEHTVTDVTTVIHLKGIIKPCIDTHMLSTRLISDRDEKVPAHAELKLKVSCLQTYNFRNRETIITTDLSHHANESNIDLSNIYYIILYIIFAMCNSILFRPIRNCRGKFKLKFYRHWSINRVCKKKKGIIC